MAGWLIRLTAPLAQRLARAYGLQVLPGLRAHGQHPLTFADPAEAVANAVPRSCYFNTRSGSITVGHDTVFGEDVKVLTGMHMGKAQAVAAGKPLHFVPESGRDIVIGAGCYIGSGAILIGPLTIGDHAMIGAGAVVTKDVPANCFVGGNPARIVKRFAD